MLSGTNYAWNLHVIWSYTFGIISFFFGFCLLWIYEFFNFGKKLDQCPLTAMATHPHSVLPGNLMIYWTHMVVRFCPMNTPWDFRLGQNSRNRISRREFCTINAMVWHLTTMCGATFGNWIGVGANRLSPLRYIHLVFHNQTLATIWI